MQLVSDSEGASELERLRTFVEVVEERRWLYAGGNEVCFVCLWRRGEGHHADCWLENALEAARGE